VFPAPKQEISFQPVFYLAGSHCNEVPLFITGLCTVVIHLQSF